MTKAVAVVSGGMDSTVLAYMMKAEGVTDLTLLSVDYGQRHNKELAFAARTASKLDAPHEIADLRGITHLLSGSALTSSDVAVPDGHYAEESMKATVVPNRNMILLAVAVGLAVSREAEFVATGVHAGDHFIYPDCRPDFISALNVSAQLGTEGFGAVQVKAPFVQMTKTEIASLGWELGVPWEDTWSCYKGGDVHCGTCGTCVERREAFSESSKGHDPTVYAG